MSRNVKLLIVNLVVVALILAGHCPVDYKHLFEAITGVAITPFGAKVMMFVCFFSLVGSYARSDRFSGAVLVVVTFLYLLPILHGQIDLAPLALFWGVVTSGTIIMMALNLWELLQGRQGAKVDEVPGLKH